MIYELCGYKVQTEFGLLPCLREKGHSGLGPDNIGCHNPFSANAPELGQQTNAQKQKTRPALNASSNKS